MSRARKSSTVHDLAFKVIILGDAGVGKTCLLTRYCDNSFTVNFIHTIGIDFKINSVEVDDKKIKMMIWDTAGQERFSKITRAFFKGTDGIIFAYDVNCEKSLNRAMRWVRQSRTDMDTNVPSVLVGNKIDMGAHKREVPSNTARALAKEYNLGFFETSAKTDQGVDEMFVELCRKLCRQHRESFSGSFSSRSSQVNCVDLKKKNGKKCPCVIQ